MTIRAERKKRRARKVKGYLLKIIDAMQRRCSEDVNCTQITLAGDLEIDKLVRQCPQEKQLIYEAGYMVRDRLSQLLKDAADTNSDTGVVKS